MSLEENQEGKLAQKWLTFSLNISSGPTKSKCMNEVKVIYCLEANEAYLCQLFMI
jgi:hypothetical protein